MHGELHQLFRWCSRTAAPTCANRLHVISNPHHHFSEFNITFGPLKQVFAFPFNLHISSTNTNKCKRVSVTTMTRIL